MCTTTRSIAAALTVMGAAHGLTVAAEAQDVRIEWSLERAWSVGDPDADTVILSVRRAKNVAVDRRNRLYLLDSRESIVRVYDTEGRRVASLGRSGSGPGEWQQGESVTIDTSGRALVHDLGNQRLVGLDGQRPPTTRSTAFVPVPLQELHMLSDGSIVAFEARRDTARLVRVVGSQRERLATLPYPVRRSTPPVCNLTDYSTAPILSPSLLIASRDSSVAINTGGVKIELLRGSRRVVFSRSGTNRRRASVETAKKFLGAGIVMRFPGMPECTVPADMLIAAGGVAEFVPMYSALAIDAQGRVWATRFSLAEEVALADIFDSARGYLGTVSLGSARPVAFLTDGSLVSLETTADEVPIVVVYRVRPRGLPPPKLASRR
ncbi:MAG: 6-bladed beta-propeller [Gemmatimonadetes bacterium]|nr:6-bladed beta-propeller [Gemmatimonadota bacterium]